MRELSSGRWLYWQGIQLRSNGALRKDTAQGSISFRSARIVQQMERKRHYCKFRICRFEADKENILFHAHLRRPATAFHRSILAFAVVASCLLPKVPVLAAGNSSIMQQYPDSKLRKETTLAYSPFTMPVGATDKALEFEPLVGDLSRTFQCVESVSTLQICEDYSAALKKAEFEVLYSCSLEACGTKPEWFGGWISPEGTVYNYHTYPYYIVVRKLTAGDPVWVAMFAGRYQEESAIQLDIMAERALQTGAVKVDTDLLCKAAEAPEPISPAAAKEDDSPLLPRYPGSKLRKSTRTEYEPINLPENVADESRPYKLPFLRLVGNSTQHFYFIENVSTLKLYENYRQALVDAGFAIDFTCRLDECGNDDQAKVLGNSVPVETSVYNSHKKPYYLLASKDAPDGKVHVRLRVLARLLPQQATPLKTIES